MKFNTIHIKHSLIIALILIISACKAREINEKQIYVSELKAGIIKADIMFEDSLKSAPNGTRNITSDNYNYLLLTDSIPAKEGIQFGVDYKINCLNCTSINVELVWKYPKGMRSIQNKKIKKTQYQIGKRTNIKQSSNYTLDKNLCVKGKWDFQILYKKNKIFEKSFYLY